MVVGKNWKKDWKTVKLYSAICRLKIHNGYQIYNTVSLRKLKKIDSIHRERIIIDTGAIKTSSVEATHIKANDLPLELKKNELGLRFLYKLRSNPT